MSPEKVGVLVFKHHGKDVDFNLTFRVCEFTGMSSLIHLSYCLKSLLYNN